MIFIFGVLQMSYSEREYVFYYYLLIKICSLSEGGLEPPHTIGLRPECSTEDRSAILTPNYKQLYLIQIEIAESCKVFRFLAS